MTANISQRTQAHEHIAKDHEQLSPARQRVQPASKIDSGGCPPLIVFVIAAVLVIQTVTTGTNFLFGLFEGGSSKTITSGQHQEFKSTVKEMRSTAAVCEKQGFDDNETTRYEYGIIYEQESPGTAWHQAAS